MTKKTFLNKLVVNLLMLYDFRCLKKGIIPMNNGPFFYIMNCFSFF